MVNMKTWSAKKLEEHILQLEDDIDEIKDEVCHSVCIVSVCLSKIHVLS